MNTAKMTKHLQSIDIPIGWNVPDNIITRFANNIVVQQLEDGFRLMFFEVYPNIRLGKSENPPKEVQANCVASIIISTNKLSTFTNVLQGMQKTP